MRSDVTKSRVAKWMSKSLLSATLSSFVLSAHAVMGLRSLRCCTRMVMSDICVAIAWG